MKTLDSFLRSAALAIGSAVAAAVPTGCGEEPAVAPGDVATGDVAEEAGAKPDAGLTAGQARMIEILAEVERRTPDENQILGDLQARSLRPQVALMPPDTKPARAISLLVRLGGEELRLGNEETAIGHLTRARQLVEELVGAGQLSPDFVYNASYMLGVAHLRRGETENCCAQRSPESCLLPIQGAGIHRRPESAQEAMIWFTEVLEMAPTDSPIYLRAKWLLNIAAMSVDAYPRKLSREHAIDESVFASADPFPRFENIAGRLGLDDFDLAGGVVADDLDGDGDIDLMVSTWDPSETLSLYENDGTGAFTDRSSEANLDGLLGGFNLIHGDYDNDGDLDVLVLRGAWIGVAGRIPNSLLRNDGNLRFTDVTFESGLGETQWPTQTGGWSDYDNDGDLDLYIGNEVHRNLPSPCQLFRNEGDGTFVDVAEAAGVVNIGLTKSVAWGDYDADGFSDLYVSNLGQPNRLYRNLGDGTFEDVATALGVDGPRMSFPTWFWDFDNDGVLDLYVASYDWTKGNLAAVVASRVGVLTATERPRLNRGDGRGGFTNVAAAQGLTDITLPMGANFGDVDGDGFLDFYLGTGYPDYEGLMPNVMYRNRGGSGFSDVTYAGGFGHLQKGHGIAFADLDGDGDQDVFAQMGGFFPGDRFSNVVFENPGFGNRWIEVHLVGVRSNRSAIGARIEVETVDGQGAHRTIYRHVNSGGSFGANPLRQNIGLGDTVAIERLVIRWPATGEEEEFRDVPLDTRVRITEGAGAVRPVP